MGLCVEEAPLCFCIKKGWGGYMDIYEEALLGVASVCDFKEMKVYNGEAMVLVLIKNGLDVDLARETVELFVQDFKNKCVVVWNR